MLTSLNIDEQINLEDQKATVVGNVKITTSKRELKLYLPLLMDGITFGKPKVSTAGKLNNAIFANDKSCKPKCSSKTIKEQNYLTGYMSANSAVKFKQSASRQGGNVTSKFIKHGTNLRARFLNKKINKLRANTNE